MEDYKLAIYAVLFVTGIFTIFLICFVWLCASWRKRSSAPDDAYKAALDANLQVMKTIASEVLKSSTLDKQHEASGGRAVAGTLIAMQRQNSEILRVLAILGHSSTNPKIDTKALSDAINQSLWPTSDNGLQSGKKRGTLHPVTGVPRNT